MCGQKQSLKRVYSEGAAKNCRQIVLELNMRRSEEENNMRKYLFDHDYSDDENEESINSNDPVSEFSFLEDLSERE
eukprot:Pgem_evm1s18664